jgi:hypothetical protein
MPSLLNFKHCRFTKLDDTGYTPSMALNKNFGVNKGFKANDSVEYDIFNSDKDVIAKQAGGIEGVESYRGQVYFQFWDNRYIYPLSPYDPVYLDADTEWQVSLYKNRELRNGFMLRHIISVAQFENEEQFRDFEKTINGQEGSDGARVAIIEAEFDETTGDVKNAAAFKVEKVDTNVNDKLFENWEQSLANKIRKANKALPAILIDYESGKLGTTSGEAIIQAVAFYNGMTLDDRALMSRVFSELFRNSSNETLKANTNWKIEPFTMEEKIEEKVVDEAEALRLDSQAKLKGSVGGVTALITLQQSVAEGTSDLEAAVAIVEEIYGIPKEKAREMIGTPKQVETEPQNPV